MGQELTDEEREVLRQMQWLNQHEQNLREQNEHVARMRRETGMSKRDLWIMATIGERLFLYLTCEWRISCKYGKHDPHGLDTPAALQRLVDKGILYRAERGLKFSKRGQKFYYELTPAGWQWFSDNPELRKWHTYA